MGYRESWNKKVKVPAFLMAVFIGIFLAGIAAPSLSLAATISCGGCHSNPPVDADSGGCKLTTKSHPEHSSGADMTTCDRCHPNVASPGHPNLKHNNNLVNITSPFAPGLSYDTSSGWCANACHDNRDDTPWGGTLNCNSCHFRSGAAGTVTMSGLHIVADRSWKHYSSPIKFYDNTRTITCIDCHPDNESENATPRAHIGSTDFVKRADLSEAFANVTVTGIGYVKGVTQGTGTCSKSCHYNGNDPFGTYTIYFKPGQTRRFGIYQSANWADEDLKCNECHSTPGQEATFGSVTSIRPFGHATSAASKNANKRHEGHMFRYKLNPWNFQNEDRNIYCDDCHRTPDINMVRGFQFHSTVGYNNSGTISLPVKSQYSKVYMLWRNNGIGSDGVNPPDFSETGNCTNIYCHTIMSNGRWTEEACDACHGVKNGVNVGSGAPGYQNWTANFRTFEDYSGGGGAHYTHVTKRGYPCRDCHYDGGGDGNAENHHDVSERIVYRANVNVGVHPDFWFNNETSYYDLQTRSCNNVRCHYGSSQNWDCEPYH